MTNATSTRAIERTSSPAWLAPAARLAIAGPILFGLTTQALILLQRDFLSQFGNLEDEFPISANALGPYGLVMILNFLMLGTSVVALAILLWRTTRAGIATRFGVALLALAGAGLAAEASPMEFPPATHWWGQLHYIAFYVWALALLAAYVALAIGLTRDPSWRAYGWYTAATIVATLALVFTAPWAADDVVTKHGAWWGPLGRAHFIVWIAWFSVMAWRASRLLTAPRT